MKKSTARSGLPLRIMKNFIALSQNVLCGSKKEISLAVDWYIKHGNKSRVMKFLNAKERNFAKDIEKNGGSDGDA